MFPNDERVPDDPCQIAVTAEAGTGGGPILDKTFVALDFVILRGPFFFFVPSTSASFPVESLRAQHFPNDFGEDIAGVEASSVELVIEGVVEVVSRP
jgi:hypothetical protein